MKIYWTNNPLYTDTLICEYLHKSANTSNLVPTMVPVHRNNSTTMEIRLKNPNKDKLSFRERAAQRKQNVEAQQKAIDEQSKKLEKLRTALSKRFIAPTKTITYPSNTNSSSTTLNSHADIATFLGYNPSKIKSISVAKLQQYTENIPTVEENNNSMYMKWKSSLTANEEKVATIFIDKGANIVNTFLQGLGRQNALPTNPPSDKLLSSIKTMVTHVDSAIEKFKLDKPITVRTYFNVPRSTTISQLFPNGVLINPGYTITQAFKPPSGDHYCSIASSTATEADKLTKGYKSIALAIKVPAGKGIGAYMGPLSETPLKHQFVFPRGTKFQLETDVTMKTLRDHTDIVYLTVRPVGRDVANWEDIKREKLEEIEINRQV